MILFYKKKLINEALENLFFCLAISFSIKAISQSATILK